MISIGGITKESLADLSPRCQALLSLIPGAAEWIRWAVKNIALRPLYFHDEGELLEFVTLGLHSNSMVRFMSFRLDLKKLLRFSDEDIDQLAVAQGTPNDNEDHLKRIMKRHHLVGYKELDDVMQELTKGDFPTRDYFLLPTFGELIQLSRFMNRYLENDEKHNNLAWAFVKEQPVATISEFIDLFHFALHAASHPSLRNLAVKLRQEKLQEQYDRLSPMVNYLLFTPVVDPNQDDADLRVEIQRAAESDRIGYLTRASGVRDLAANIDMTSLHDQELEEGIEDFVMSLRELIATSPAGKAHTSQDGQVTTFHVENEHAKARIGINATGTVYLLPQSNLKHLKDV